jgi:hypothetical protein
MNEIGRVSYRCDMTRRFHVFCSRVLFSIQFELIAMDALPLVVRWRNNCRSLEDGQMPGCGTDLPRNRSRLID